MRVFMIFLLAAGALAVEKTWKPSANKYVKRGSLTDASDFNAYNIEQLDQKLVRYTQPGYQRAAQVGPVSAYTSDLAFQAGSLPLENQHQPQPTGVYDSQLGQILLRQLRQGFDHPGNFQEQQVAQGIHGYSGDVSTDGQPNEGRLSTVMGNVPLSVRHQVYFARTLQMPMPMEGDRSVKIPFSNSEPPRINKIHQVNVDRTLSVPVRQSSEVQRATSVPVPVAIQEPVILVPNYDDSFGPDQNIIIDDSVSQEHQNFEELDVALQVGHAGSLEPETNVGSVTDSQLIDALNRQYDLSEFHNVFSNVHNVANYNRPVEKLAQVPSRVSDIQHSGYHYDVPVEKLSF